MKQLELQQVRGLTLAFILWALLPTAPALAQNSDCDCSCESFHEMRSMIEDLQAGADAGEAVMPSAELQRIAGCAGQCAMAWGQCGNRGDTSDPPARASRSGRTDKAPVEEDTRPKSDTEAYALGKPRDDLERFHGVYGSTDHPNRDFFVTEARNSRGEGPEIPPGYLMIGAMWGDVSPWYMKSMGELRFEQQWTGPAAEPLVVEFETDRDGQILSMRFVSGFLADRGEVQRRGDLPEGW